ncbi:unnamed protein product [Ceratitis capitata]|uniref:(Mediterranean fruit fly) hypothetical protein n=1 Tax=Ceratitis capitata TaxID=7213 RepID=A0A811U4Q3_CERCA|nr:unnamed protein product [Ceratitis capitata]
MLAAAIKRSSESGKAGQGKPAFGAVTARQQLIALRADGWLLSSVAMLLLFSTDQFLNYAQGVYKMATGNAAVPPWVA